MWAIVDIRKAVRWLYQIAGDAALWCWDNDPPFGWFGDRFLDAYFALTDLHHALYELALWFQDLEDRVAAIFTESDILRLLRTWLTYAEDAWSWVYNAFSNVVAIIDAWWSTVLPTVQGLISIATEGLAELRTAWDSFWNVTWPGLLNSLATLTSEWDDFWQNIYPNLVSFTWLNTWWTSTMEDVQGLINTAIQELAPFWEGWQEIRDQVLEFFADPLTWLEDRFTDWFLGGE